ncbi:protein SRC2-like [Impatiens glandulifera]|uniref:protein SRC2-like n=1 Tax=Impatiens glandulifera TaxID=253017 RepID=UPI001FB11FF1|nr:protein SRC2-like [Impatiens glandulifera]
MDNHHHRTLEINVRSAKHLNDVNYISKMDVYAVVFISGDSKSSEKFKTTIDRAGGTNPSWNFPIQFSIDESAARQNRLTLVIILRCDRSLGDKKIGEIRVPIKDLLAPAPAGGGVNKPQFVTYQVRKPSGSPRGGELHFSYKWADKRIAATVEEPVTAYPVACSGSGVYCHVIPTVDPYPAAGSLYPKVEPYVYIPSPVLQGYGPYGYPVRPGYGYYSPVQEPANNRFGFF